jgi:hypothetical protein
MLRRALKLGTCLVAPILAVLAFAGTGAAASESRAYDYVLSLTGDCSTSAVDPIPDPGCPENPPPPPRFNQPCGTATDRHGYIYVSTPKMEGFSVIGTRIDVFNAQGEWVVRTEVADVAACGLAVDSEGNIYSGALSGVQVDLFKPSVYPPTVSTGYARTELIKDPFTELGCPSNSLAVDPSNDHFYLAGRCRALEYGSAAEGSLRVGEFTIPKGEVSGGNSFLIGIDVYGATHDIYAAVAMQDPSGSPTLPSRIYVFDGGDGHVKCEVLGVETPGDLDFGIGASVAVDQSTGDIFVYSTRELLVHQFAPPDEGECAFIGRLPKPPALAASEPFGDIAVDAPMVEGEAGYDSPNEGYVYVTSGTTISSSHLFAFRRRFIDAPAVKEQRVDSLGQTEALLQAQLNPGGLSTTYHFEYLTEAAYLANGESFAGPQGATSVPVPDVSLAAGGAFVAVSEPITGLSPDTAYRFRLVASNCADPEAIPGECLTVGEGNPGGEGTDATFVTYAPLPLQAPCPNDALRTGTSAVLPDCRAYELVTPPDTNGHVPTAAMLGPFYVGIGFRTALASPAGDSVVFGSFSGALPGLGGGGFHDTYEARRDPAKGWQSHFTGLTAAQGFPARPGAISEDHGYSFWSVELEGTLAPDQKQANYVRVPPGIEPSPNCAPASEPKGHFEWIGCGSLGFDPLAGGKWISVGGGHIVFQTGNKAGTGSLPVRLEPCAPPNGVRAIYDRAPGGPTHCVSVPPAGASPQVQEEFETRWAEYKGVNPAGTTVVFEVAGTLYARLDNAETVVVAEDNATFGGVSADGDRVFYLKDAVAGQVPRGEIFVCQVSLGPCAGSAAHAPIPIGSGGEAALVNVSADGSHVYFTSLGQLDGEAGQEGEDNLYVWDGSSIRFIVVLDPADLDGGSDPYLQGLGLWVTSSLEPEPDLAFGPAQNPSRTTPDGKVLVFQSHADLVGSHGEGHWQLFRYDSEAPPGTELTCLSCNPTGAPAGSDARLQTAEGDVSPMGKSPLSQLGLIANLTDDGNRLFFESGDRLVAQDLDGKVDVYEWEAEGVGGCQRKAGCLSLISGGRSPEDDYLYAVTPDGSDAFFLSSDVLNREDPDRTPSIYDARVDGGFPPPVTPPKECLGEACQPVVSPPDDTTPASSSFEGTANLTGSAKRRCPRGMRRVRRAGKTRCIRRNGEKRGHHRQRHHMKSNANQKAGR